MTPTVNKYPRANLLRALTQPKNLFWLVTIVVFLTRLPFLNAGYGNDPDAWRVAAAAQSIAANGRYIPSRLPGYPLQEIACSLFWQGGPLVLNGIAALFSALACAFFALSWQALGGRHSFLAALGLAFIPLILINSTVSMDYLWALAFVLGSLYAILRSRPLLAGILLGMAIGCRLTSGAMLFPLGLMLYQPGKRQDNLRNLAVFAVGTGLVGVLAFLPVVLRYGTSFFSFLKVGYPPWPEVLHRASVQVWGTVGIAGLLVALLTTVRRPHTTVRPLPTPVPKRYLAAWALVIPLYLLAYLRLPHEAAYLIPTLPFILLLLGRALHQRVFTLLCLTLLLSSFICLGGARLQSDTILTDRALRVQSSSHLQQIVSFGEQVEEKSVIVAGPWLPGIRALVTYRDPEIARQIYIPETSVDLSTAQSHPLCDGAATYVYDLDDAQQQRYLDEGFKIYFLPDMRSFNLGQTGMDLLEAGGQPITLGP